jgi:hypothetical protein
MKAPKIAKKWDKESILAKLNSDPEFTKRALLKLFELQTHDEQNSENTIEHNGVGFNGTDGYIMTAIAKHYIAKQYISPKQMAIVDKKIKKYAQQIANIANRLDAIKKVKAENTPTPPPIVILEPKQHRFHSASFCECGAFIYTCVKCKNVRCQETTPPTWGTEIAAGNVCPTCVRIHTPKAPKEPKQLDFFSNEDFDPAGGHGLNSHI